MAKESRTPSTITGVFPAGEDHRVVRVEQPGSNSYDYRRSPCRECPWRKDALIGAFPAEAYRHSTKTAYDMADSVFSCHMAKVERPQTCAGFLLRGADDNLQVRMRLIEERIDLDEVSSDVELYEGYRDMAIANGVDPDDPVLKPCRN